MVLAQCLFKFLKQRHAECVIDVVAPAWTLPLLQRMPEVNEGIGLDITHGELGLGKRIELGRALRRRGYDWAIVLPNSFKSALVPAVAGIRRRSGFVGEFRYGLLNDARRLDKQALPKTVDRFVALALAPNETLPTVLPTPRLIANQENATRALKNLGHDLPRTPVLGLCPGAEYGSSKRWPTEYFAEIARTQLRQGWEVWLFGSGRDTPITHAINAATDGRCFDLGGVTSLAEAIDLLSMTNAVISNDSGLMHVAAALDRHVLALYGSSDPGHTPPMSSQAEVLYLGIECSPCFERECPLGHHKCLRDISPARVLTALTK